MVDTALMREVADWIEAHPKHYNFGWRNCIAGRAVRLRGGRFIYTKSDLYRNDRLRPTHDDPEHHVHTDFGSSTRYVMVRDRAKRLFGLTDIAADRLFIYMPYSVIKDNATSVAAYLRRTADLYDRDALN